MIKITDGHDNWWECPKCHRTVGKKEETESNEKTES